MIKEAIQYLLELKTPDIVKDTAGREFSTRKLTPLTDSTETMECQTLSGLVDYMASLYAKDAVKKCKEADHVFLIENEINVIITSETNEDFLDRDKLALANCKAFVVGNFFGRWMDAEEFAIGLQTYFAHTEDLVRLMMLTGNINKASVVNNEDDGVSQRTTIKKGVALQKDVTVKNPFTLAPYRTFPEIEQPPSNFVLRLREYSDEVQVALFEADRGRWKLEAVKRIKEYLIKGSNPELPVIG